MKEKDRGPGKRRLGEEAVMRMRENEAVERVVARVYRDRLMKTGRLPDGRETREIEKKVKEAVAAEDRKRRK